jgi:hypothetical protein
VLLILILEGLWRGLNLRCVIVAAVVKKIAG